MDAFIDSGQTLLSIIVPAYNSELYIQAPLLSIISQNIDYIEIIVVDDGSTDNTYQRASDILSSVPNDRYHIIRTKNKGVSSARNVGMKKASGRYIYFLDSDDYVADNFVNQIMPYLKGSDHDILCWGYDTVNEEGKIVDRFFDKFTFGKCEMTGLHVLENIILDKNMHIGTLNFAFKKSLPIQKNISYFEECSCGEDLEFIYKLLLGAESVLLLNDTLSFYTVRENSITNSYNFKTFDFFDAILRVSAYFTNSKIESAIVMAEILENEYLLTHYLMHLRSLVKHSKKIRLNKILKDLNSLYPDINSRINEILNGESKYYKSIFIQAKLYYLSPIIYILSYKAYLKVLAVKTKMWRS